MKLIFSVDDCLKCTVRNKYLYTNVCKVILNIFFVCFGQIINIICYNHSNDRCQYNQTIIHPISYSSVRALTSTVVLNMYLLDPLVDNDTDCMWGNVVYAPCATVVTLVGHTLLLRTITLQTQRRHVFHHKISHQISTMPLPHIYSYEVLKITVLSIEMNTKYTCYMSIHYFHLRKLH